MGFFENMTDKAASPADATPDTIMDELMNVPAPHTADTELPNTVEEIFETTKGSVSLVSENEEEVLQLEGENTFASIDPESAILTVNEEVPANSDESLLAIVSEENITNLETPLVADTTSMAMPDLHIQEGREGEDIVDVDSTIRRAIAELEANASKIQFKVDAALLEESQLLEEKTNQEIAHKIAIEALQKAAESARKTAEEIKKSGERTEQLKKLLEKQLV